MDWILDEAIEDIRARIKALENVIKDSETHRSYAAAKQDEIIFLQDQLEDIEYKKREFVRDFEAAEEDYRQNRAYSQI